MEVTINEGPRYVEAIYAKGVGSTSRGCLEQTGGYGGRLDYFVDVAKTAGYEFELNN